jgi:hypothetical protein
MRLDVKVRFLLLNLSLDYGLPPKSGDGCPEHKKVTKNRNLELRETIMVGEMATNSSDSVYKIQRQLFARSERVKGIDFHPVEPWILTTLYSGMLKRIRCVGNC